MKKFLVAPKPALTGASGTTMANVQSRAAQVSNIDHAPALAWVNATAEKPTLLTATTATVLFGVNGKNGPNVQSLAETVKKFVNENATDLASATVTTAQSKTAPTANAPSGPSGKLGATAATSAMVATENATENASDLANVNTDTAKSPKSATLKPVPPGPVGLAGALVLHHVILELDQSHVNASARATAKATTPPRKSAPMATALRGATGKIGTLARLRAAAVSKFANENATDSANATSDMQNKRAPAASPTVKSTASGPTGPSAVHHASRKQTVRFRHENETVWSSDNVGLLIYLSDAVVREYQAAPPGPTGLTGQSVRQRAAMVMPSARANVSTATHALETIANEKTAKLPSVRTGLNGSIGPAAQAVAAVVALQEVVFVFTAAASLTATEIQLNKTVAKFKPVPSGVNGPDSELVQNHAEAAWRCVVVSAKTARPVSTAKEPATKNASATRRAARPGRPGTNGTNVLLHAVAESNGEIENVAHEVITTSYKNK